MSEGVYLFGIGFLEIVYAAVLSAEDYYYEALENLEYGKMFAVDISIS